MSTVSSVSSYFDPSTTDTITGAGSKTLSQNDFLKLLVTQMTSQDPMNPQTDTQMAANMAQFTSLQQSSTMSQNIASLLAQQQVLEANSMLGGTVSIQADAKTVTSGVVQAVQLENGVPKLLVNNTTYDLSQVLTITPTPVNDSSTTATAVTAATLPQQTVSNQTMP